MICSIAHLKVYSLDIAGPEAIKEGLVAPELLVKNGSTSPVQLSSPLVEMLNKRLKASNKKIVCVWYVFV